MDFEDHSPADVVRETMKRRLVETDIGRGEVHLKTVFVGDRNVGKTQLTRQLRVTDFNPLVQSTKEKDIFEVGVHIDDITVFLDVWDTGGQERYRSLAPQFFRGSHICVFVYDITDRRTFESLRDWWIPQFMDQPMDIPAHDAGSDGSPNAAIIGTHSDLDHFRQVDLDMLKKLASEHNLLFAEASSVEEQGADEIKRAIKYLTLQVLEYLQTPQHMNSELDDNADDMDHLEKSMQELREFKIEETEGNTYWENSVYGESSNEPRDDDDIYLTNSDSSGGDSSSEMDATIASNILLDDIYDIDVSVKEGGQDSTENGDHDQEGSSNFHSFVNIPLDEESKSKWQKVLKPNTEVSVNLPHNNTIRLASDGNTASISASSDQPQKSNDCCA